MGTPPFSNPLMNIASRSYVSNFSFMGNVKRNKRADLEGEIWKDCPSFKNYKASNLGWLQYPSGHRTLGCVHKDKGYRYAAPSKYQPYPKAIHLFVADAFLQPDPERIFVNHKDRDRANNALKNLERVSPSENSIHAWHSTKHCSTCSCNKNLP